MPRVTFSNNKKKPRRFWIVKVRYFFVGDNALSVSATATLSAKNLSNSVLVIAEPTREFTADGEFDDDIYTIWKNPYVTCRINL